MSLTFTYGADPEGGGGGGNAACMREICHILEYVTFLNNCLDPPFRKSVSAPAMYQVVPW